MPTTIVVPVDETRGAERAVPVAAALAARCGGRVDLVTVDSPHVEPGEMEAYQCRILGTVPALQRGDGTVVLTDEPVADVLIETGAAREPSLLCMAATGRGPVGELLAGSVAADVVQRSTRPLVLVGPRGGPEDAADQLTGPATVALDGSDRDVGVLAAATAWARATGAEVRLLHVVADDSVPGARDEAIGLLERARTALLAEGVDASTHLLKGQDPAPVILSMLTPRGALVVGSHRHGPLGRLAFAATAMWLVHRAPCPMVVVPLGPER